MTENNDSFFGGGGEAVASAKFTNDSGPGGRTQVGGTIVGTVISTKQMDQTDFDTGEKIPDPKRPGQAKQQLQVILQTAYRGWDKASKPLTEDGEADGPPLEDDGKRAVYVKGWMIGAVGDAIRKAGETGLREGGKLAIKVTELVPPKSGNGNPFAKYAAQYQPPAAGETLFAETPAASTPAPQAPPAQPAVQPTPAPAPPAPSDDPFSDEPPF